MQYASVERGDEYAPFGNVETRNGLQERVEIPVMIRALAIPKGLRILEVGCGRGIALPVFAERLAPAELWGVDVDPSLVRIARDRIAARKLDATVVDGDLRSLPFPSAKFDLVVDFGTCYHIGGKSEGARLALDEIARVLAPAGLLVHETPIAQHLAHPVRSFWLLVALARASLPPRQDRRAVVAAAEAGVVLPVSVAGEGTQSSICRNAGLTQLSHLRRARGWP